MDEETKYQMERFVDFHKGKITKKHLRDMFKKASESTTRIGTMRNVADYMVWSYLLAKVEVYKIKN